MKTIITIFFFAFLVLSCGKEKKRIDNANPIDSLFIGEKLVSDKFFVNSIDETCNSPCNDDIDNSSEYIQNCVLNKLNFETNFNKKLELLKLLYNNKNLQKKIGKVRLTFKKVKIKYKYNDTYTEPKTSNQFFIKTSYNNKSIDSIGVFQHIDQVDFAYYIIKNFYLDNSNQLWVIEVFVGEEKIKVLNWEKYKIDSQTGKFILIKEYIGKKSNNNIPNNNLWKGNYYFEAIDKENNKTSFKIKIQDLNNISVQIIYSADEIENYKNIIAEVIEDNKIKIIFNPKLNDVENKMGEIFITNNDSDYFISGEPINFINPGNDNLVLKKLK